MLLGGLVLGDAVICDVQSCFNDFILCVRRSRHFSRRLWKDGVDKNPISLSVTSLQRGHDKGIRPIKMIRTKGTSKHT
jgi:hypothetical protein